MDARMHVFWKRQNRSVLVLDVWYWDQMSLSWAGPPDMVKYCTSSVFAPVELVDCVGVLQ